MSGKLLIFEFNSLPVALAVEQVMAPLDVQVVPVARKNYNKPLEDLIDAWSDVYNEGVETVDYTGEPLGGRMAVLCDVEQLDEVLMALRAAGIGPDCLKAVLTQHNRKWDAVKLYRELRREQQSFQRK